MQPTNIFNDIKNIISEARQKAVHSVNFERVMMYWRIGERIFEEEQKGEKRAEYGTALIKNLSKQLKAEFGSGFSARNLEMMHLFYRTFPNTQTLSAQLSWSHYTLLLSIDNQDKQEFYIAETKKNNWSVRQLERQINSQLYERLLLSNDKESVLAVAKSEKHPENPDEIIKDPMVLEFLGLNQEAS